MDVLPLDADAPSLPDSRGRQARSAAGSAGVDARAAGRFACAQAAWMSQALISRRPDEVAAALAAHGRAHPGWLRLIADLDETLGEDARETALQLYAAHGRAAGRLEREPSPHLRPGVALRVDEITVAELEERTAALLCALRGPRADASPRRR